MPIDHKYNFSDTYFRDLTICVLSTLEQKIRWVNRFSDVTKEVHVPIYYSLLGDERFLLDAFVDETVSQNRYVELNTDQIPRGHITFKGASVKSDAFANPNIFLRRIVENKEELQRILTKIRALPIRANYSLTILVSSEIDAFKCQQAILNTMWLYKYMYFEYSFMNIDAVMYIPDEAPIEINREQNLGSDTAIKVTLDFEVHTYYPAYDEKQVFIPPIGVQWGQNLYFTKDAIPPGQIIQSITASST